MKDVRITVKKMISHDELISEYENPISHACDMNIGMVFVSKQGLKPQNMCDSAWQSMKDFVMTLAHGGRDFYEGWMKNPYSAMISCNDGFRPVSFLLEVVDD